MADKSDNKGDFLVGLLVGGALGAALALLYAPQAGGETRETLKKRGEELKDNASTTYDRVKSQTSTLASQVRESTSTLAANARDSATKVRGVNGGDVPSGAGVVTPTDTTGVPPIVGETTG